MMHVCRETAYIFHVKSIGEYHITLYNFASVIVLLICAQFLIAENKCDWVSLRIDALFQQCFLIESYYKTQALPQSFLTILYFEIYLNTCKVFWRQQSWLNSDKDPNSNSSFFFFFFFFFRI